MAVVVDEEALAAKSRVALLVLTNLDLRLMENWRRLQRGLWGRTLDYESTLILLAVVAIRIEPLAYPEWEPELETLSTAVPAGRLKKCNLSSIAATTNLNRETVRRKVLRLKASGLLISYEGGGIGMGEGIMQDEQVLAGVREQIRALQRATNALIHSGIFRA